jgi:hypothetical protein
MVEQGMNCLTIVQGLKRSKQAEAWAAIINEIIRRLHHKAGNRVAPFKGDKNLLVAGEFRAFYAGSQLCSGHLGVKRIIVIDASGQVGKGLPILGLGCKVNDGDGHRSSPF